MQAYEWGWDCKSLIVQNGKTNTKQKNIPIEKIWVDNSSRKKKKRIGLLNFNIKLYTRY